MGSVEEFESMLKDVVQAKRISASKMSNLTNIAMNLMENDTQLVSTLYRTHKSLPPAAKVSSLYAFDALSRAARHHVNKHGVTVDADSTKGNSATFLAKIEGVLEGLFQDMRTIDNSEAKEKAKKILDIWVKGSTFPPRILTRLKSVVEAEKVSEVPSSSTAVIDPRIATVQPAASISTLPVQTASPQPLALDPQATLLALLAQAANAAAMPSQTTTNTSVPAGLDAAQLAVLQQLALAQTANNGAPSQATPLQQNFPAVTHATAFSTSSYREESSYNSHKDPRHNGPQSSDRVNAYDDQPEDRSSYRGSFRGGFRGRGRGRWDERDRDRYRERERDERGSPRRMRRSRSRSPPRYGARRDVKTYSPPRRPNFSLSETPHGNVLPVDTTEKDEFGRDIRPQSPDVSATPPKSDAPQSPRSSSSTPAPAPAPAPAPIASSTSQLVTEPLVDASSALTSNHDRMSLSPLIAANKSPSIPSAPIVTNTGLTQPGLEKFDPMTFDVTSPSSWEALGEMWQVTNGYMPSTEELMQFVMASSQVAFAPAQIQGSTWQGTQTGHSGWRGRGRGGFRGRGGSGYNNHFRNSQEHWGQYETNQETDAVVLGGGPSECGTDINGVQMESSRIDETHGAAAGGKMQRIGDKWVFVRETTT